MTNIFYNSKEIKDALPKGKTFTLVGGSFDLIHVGHLFLLEYASLLEDILVIALLSDSYIKKYKNQTRPIINERQRAKMVASIKFVDFVYITDISPSSIETLEILKPDSVVFGQDFENKKKIDIRLKNIKISSSRTEVHFLPRFTKEEISTSLIIKKIKSDVIF
ncbi:MAG: adenylyltransferase/cytidyltransferase family protein [Candidatus Taylorbacteria bacterium]|nr:adenylyltransferase/cytidyltransferase family protein [Candidatus Taylorbacteria bacterium]